MGDYQINVDESYCVINYEKLISYVIKNIKSEPFLVKISFATPSNILTFNKTIRKICGLTGGYWSSSDGDNSLEKEYLFGIGDMKFPNQATLGNPLKLNFNFGN